MKKGFSSPFKEDTSILAKTLNLKEIDVVVLVPIYRGYFNINWLLDLVDEFDDAFSSPFIEDTSIFSR